MSTLDEMSGFEFEDLMEDVFRNLGYENVRQASKTADEGRDVLMEEVVDGTRQAVVVECKHTGSVGRPVVQKLHSAIATFEFDGPKRGIVVTTGRFTEPATEYVERLSQSGDPYQIELINGTELRAIGDEIGLDLYNGRIEILCDETLRPYDPSSSVEKPVQQAFRDIENISLDAVPTPSTHVDFQPVVRVDAETNAVFETSVGVVNRIRENSRFIVFADREGPRVPSATVQRLVTSGWQQTIDLDEDRFEREFDSLTAHRFEQTETAYKDWAVEQIQQRQTETVSYTGDNNVTYEKTCEPNRSDISVGSISPVYLPRIRQTTDLQSYSYPYEYYAAGPSRETVEDGIHRCVQCGSSGDGTYTHCENCGSINCGSHIKTERVEQEPICTGCAITEQFMLATKYFYDHENLEQFRTEYDELPPHQKLMENPPLAVGSVLAVVLVVAMALTSAGLL